jgi:PIN domain nuclease of toxin-antitoxin system
MMRLLLDTCALLWFLTDDPKLSSSAKVAIEDPANERWLSPASVLEIALKVRIGKLPLHRPFGAGFPQEMINNDIHLLPLDLAHIEPLTTLPLHHKDPFDRLIAATALVEQLTLVSADTVFDAYGVTRLW